MYKLFDANDYKEGDKIFADLEQPEALHGVFKNGNFFIFKLTSDNFDFIYFFVY